MKIAVIGANGRMGRMVVDAGMYRGHQMIAVVRNPENQFNSCVEKRIADGADRDSLIRALAGADVAVQVFPPNQLHPETYPQENQNVIDACKANGARLLTVLGDSSCICKNLGIRLADTDYFHEGSRNFYYGICDSVPVYEAEKELDWVIFHPGAEMDCEKNGRHYRTGDERLLCTDDNTMYYFRVSQITFEDFVCAILDEIEGPRHNRQRVCVAY